MYLPTFATDLPMAMNQRTGRVALVQSLLPVLAQQNNSAFVQDWVAHRPLLYKEAAALCKTQVSRNMVAAASSRSE